MEGHERQGFLSWKLKLWNPINRNNLALLWSLFTRESSVGHLLTFLSLSLSSVFLSLHWTQKGHHSLTRVIRVVWLDSCISCCSGVDNSSSIPALMWIKQFKSNKLSIWATPFPSSSSEHPFLVIYENEEKVKWRSVPLDTHTEWPTFPSIFTTFLYSSSAGELILWNNIYSVHLLETTTTLPSLIRMFLFLACYAAELKSLIAQHKPVPLVQSARPVPQASLEGHATTHSVDPNYAIV